MAEAKINNSIGSIDEDTKNPFNKTFEKVVGRTIDSIDIYQSHTETSLNPEFKFCIMNISKDGEDGKKALSILEKSAAEGSTEAMYFLGQHYHLRKQDDEKAIFWHTKAAENGNTRSQICLAYLLVEKHQFEKAIKYLKLANQNEAAKTEVMYIMSHLYQNGEGVKQDAEKALALLKEAAKNDHTCALFELGHYYISQKDFKSALKCYKKSAELGDHCGAYNYAACYANGEGVVKDNKKALEIINNFVEEFGQSKMLTDLIKKIKSNDQLHNTQSKGERTSYSLIANRVYLAPVNKWPNLIMGILCCVLGLATLGAAIFILKQLVAYLPFAILLVLGIFSFTLVSSIEKANEENKKNQTYPNEAIAFGDDDFALITDKLTCIKFNEIKAVSFKTDKLRPSLAVGTVIIKTENAIYKISNIDNIYNVVSIMNQIMEKYNQK